MSWYEWSASSQRLGTAALVAQIETMLTAHAAWEFVENVTQINRQTHVATTNVYDAETYTCRVWKNLGTLNGYGKDFYVAIITSVVKSVRATDFANQHDEDQNCIWILPFEDWNTTTKKMRRPAGCDFWGSAAGDTFLSESHDYAINGSRWFNLIEAQVEVDGLTWGTWHYPDRPIGTLPADIKTDTNIWDFLYEPLIEWDNYWWGESGGSYVRVEPANNPVTAWIRVTNKGILLYSTNFDPAGADGNGDAHGGYVGLGDESGRPEETRTGFPLMYGYHLWIDDEGSSPPFSRFPEYGSALAIDYFEPGQVYDFSLEAGADRAHSHYPGITPWVAVQAKVTLNPTNTSDWYHLVYDPGLSIPGLYWHSQSGTGPFAIGDTITSPEGRLCKFALFDYNLPGASSTSKRWSIVDTEMT